MNRRAAGPAVLALVAGACALAALFAAHVAQAADPDALWKIVSGRCVPDETAKDDPAPCLAVDLRAGYAVLKDRDGLTQVLVIPTARVTGIESPDLLKADAPNYWSDAWRARTWVEKLAGGPIPRDDLALAVNSVDGRSQNQLHIHVDCVRPEVRDALRSSRARIGARWAPLALRLAGHRYEAMRLSGADLDRRDPFELLAEGDRAARADMRLETLVAVGETFGEGAPGFVLLADRADPAAGDWGAGEELMDHGCKVLAGG